MAFVHLHLHSEYSLLDGAFKIKDIPKASKLAGHNAVAITDHGNMYGAVEFYKACKAENIKPIIGCEVYVASRSRFDKSESIDGGRYHLVLLCKNEVGYKNLIDLVSKSYTEGFYYKPRIDLELLETHAEGLICLSACLAGYIPKMILSGEIDKAKEMALYFKKLFEKDSFYLELQNHGIDEQKEVNQELIKISKELDIPLVATNDIHYMKRADADAQAILMCIQTNSKLSDGRPLGFQTDEYYYKSTEEMISLFKDTPEAISNTQKIADMCNYDFDFSKTYLPKYIPENGDTPENYLKELAFSGFEKRIQTGKIKFDNINTKEVYLNRINYEIETINKMGYAQYYLIVQDFINYSKRNGISVGPGRGSGAGSLVAFLIGITEVDSIKYKLMFERFLNPERVSMPDFDTDFCDERRQEVIDYVSKKYGKDHVCGISTFGTLAARAVIRDVGRVLGCSYDTVDNIAKLIPDDPKIKLKDCLNGSLKELYDSDLNTRKIIDYSLSLEGIPRHASAHAAGIVITDKPTHELVPLSVNNGMILTEYSMDALAGLGLLKFDFLGLRFLTILSNTEALIKKTNPSFSLETIPYDDAETFNLISKGKTTGLFQLESKGMIKLLCNMQPRNIEDIITAISLYRPGPMDSIGTYLDNRKNPSNIKYKISALKSILDETSGIIIYQEQVMQICREVAGFSFGKADVVRYAMSKKKTAEMEKARESFIYGEEDSNGNIIFEGAIRRGTSIEDANEIFDTMSKFAQYAFNKSHATAYSFISYQTAYLKANYPAEYFCSLLTSVLGSTSKTSAYVNDALKYSIKLLGPNINLSDKYYSISIIDGKKYISYGLLGIKGIGENLLNNIKEERTNGEFTSFIDFVSRMSKYDINKRQIESLINSGAFDSLDQNKPTLLKNYEKIMGIYSQSKQHYSDSQMTLFSFDDIKEMDNQFEKSFEYEKLPDFSLKENVIREKEATGLYISGHPIDEYKAHIDALNVETAIYELFKENDEIEQYNSKRIIQKEAVAGIITKKIVKNTRNGTNMAFVNIEDKTGEIELIFFSNAFENFSYMLTEGNAIAVVGKLNYKDNNSVQINVDTAVQLRLNFNGIATPLIEKKDINIPRIQPEQKKQKKLYLRLPSMESIEYKKAKAVIDIFDGDIPVVYYDNSNKKYIYTELKVTIEPNMLEHLKNILGENNVVYQ